ncbi:MAG: Dyp-type peroxidase [Acidimicrobiales bacterium]
MQPQPGIFAVGMTEHCYVELELRPGAEPHSLVSGLAGLSGPDTPLAGVTAVVGFRPELWDSLRPDAACGGRSFREIRGPEMVMPATQHDAWLWIAGGSRDAVFDNTLQVLRSLQDLATVASEITGWVYQHDRDLTGFIDGTENPCAQEAVEVAIASSGPGAGSSVVLVQRWSHRESFALLGQEEQEMVIGRTKLDSTELPADVMPPDSHVSRTVVEEGGSELKIYRRNTAYGGPTEHGTLFVGFCADERPLQVMLERMAGVGDGIRDALTLHATPQTGAYYVVPPLSALASWND